MHLQTFNNNYLNCTSKSVNGCETRGLKSTNLLDTVHNKVLKKHNKTTFKYTLIYML